MLSFLLLILLVLPDVIHFLHLTRYDLHHKQNDEQEPVDVHKEQEKQQGVEEEVEWDVGNRLYAGDTRCPHNFQREPVQAKPKPGDAKANYTYVGQDVIDKMLFPAPGFEVDVDFGELQLYIIDIMQKENQNANVVISEGIGEGDQCHRDEVMDHHDQRVLPPRVHVDGGIYRVAIEATLDQVSYGDVHGDVHPASPVVKYRGRILKERVVCKKQQISAVGPGH